MNKQRKGSKKTIVALVLCLCMLWSTAIMAYAEGGTYTVKKDDNLSKIAKEVYGDRKEWRTIYEANKNIVKNPNIIYAGQQLILPGAPVAGTENAETAAPDANGAAAAVPAPDANSAAAAVPAPDANSAAAAVPAPDANDAAAAGKTPEEMTAIGDKYAEEMNYAEAMKWFEKAANLGHSGAMSRIASMYTSGAGVAQDFAKAQEWYAKAEAAAAAK